MLGHMKKAISMSDIADKWGAPVAQRGFSQVPNYLLLLNQFLDEDHRLTPTELLVLIQLVGSWWKKDALPFPSMATLAKRCGVSTRQIQRAVNSLEAGGFIQRVKRRSSGIISSNAYDLDPLVRLLGEVAKAFPNEFPRNVDKAKVAAIGESIRVSAASLRAEDESDVQTLPEASESVSSVPTLRRVVIRKKRKKPE